MARKIKIDLPTVTEASTHFSALSHVLEQFHLSKTLHDMIADGSLLGWNDSNNEHDFKSKWNSEKDIHRLAVYCAVLNNFTEDDDDDIIVI